MSAQPADLVNLRRALAAARIEVSLAELLDGLELRRRGFSAPAPEVSPRLREPAKPLPGPAPASRTPPPARPFGSTDQNADVQPGQRDARPGSGRLLIGQPDRGLPAAESEMPPAVAPVRAPTVPALRGKLAIGRALRPLKATRPSTHRRELDLAETALGSALARRLVPATRPAARRWLDLALVIDRSDSHYVWDETVREMRDLLENHGAFRRLETWHLAQDKSGEAVLVDATDRVVPKGALVPAPDRLVVILTDAVAPFWQGERIREYVRCWAARSPVVLAHLLPERHWDAASISVSQLSFHADRPGYGESLRFTDRYEGRDPRDYLAIPVVELNEDWLRPWADLLAGRGGGPVSGAGWLIRRTPDTGPDPWAAELEDWPAGQDDDADDQESREQRQLDAIRSFRGRASIPARRLARSLSLLAPAFTMPVMRAVQAAVLPESEPAHLAEVFLSGLIERVPAAELVSERGRTSPTAAGAARWFRFPRGVHEQIDTGMHDVEAAALRDAIGERLLGWWGMAAADFAAFAEAPPGERAVRLASAPTWLANLTESVLGSRSGRIAGSWLRPTAPAQAGAERPVGPRFALAGQSADEPWLAWIAATLKSFGCAVAVVGWAAPGRGAPAAPQWSQSGWRRLALVTERSLPEATWLMPGAANGPEAGTEMAGEQPVHILWIPGARLPLSLRHASVTILTPGDQQASTRALGRVAGAVPTMSRTPPDPSAESGPTLSQGPEDEAEHEAEHEADGDEPVGSLPPTAFPGSASFAHNLGPRPRYFVGRQEELSAVARMLKAAPYRDVRACVIAGSLGSGKTQLVTEYAYRNEAAYELVWRVRAHQPDLIDADLAAFARALRQHPSLSKQVAADEQKPWLAPPAGCLLIYHLAANPGELAGVWPRRGDGHVLVTTWAAAEWSGFVRSPIEIGALSPEDAEEFVRLAMAVNGREWDSAPLKGLSDFFGKYGYSPLAVAQGLKSVQAVEGSSFANLVNMPSVGPETAADGEVERPDIGLFGDAKSGKTTFAAALPVAVNRYKPRSGGSFRLTALDPETLEYSIKQVDLLTVAHEFPAPSRGYRNLSWNLRGDLPRLWPRKQQSISLNLSMVDLPGTNVSTLPGAWASRALDPILHSKGLIYFFDAESADHETALALLKGVIARLGDLAKQRNDMIAGRLPHRLAVCMTKFDRAALERFASSRGYLRPQTAGDELISPGASSRFFSELCQSIGPECVDIDQAIRSTFIERNVRYFASSAIGRYDPGPEHPRPADGENRVLTPDGPRIRTAVRPLNVLEPFLWAGNVEERRYTR